MNYNDALNSIIDDGIEAARNDYSRPDQSQKREGSILGFEECRGLNPSQLAALLAESHAMTMTKHRNQASDYWYWRCRDIEIGWVCNVISAILVINEMRPIINPTARGMLKAADITGVRHEGGSPNDHGESHAPG
jgi:hypothetical protein